VRWGGGGAGVVLAGDRLEERLPVGPLAIAATYEPGLRLAREGCRGEVPRATPDIPPAGEEGEVLRGLPLRLRALFSHTHRPGRCGAHEPAG